MKKLLIGMLILAMILCGCGGTGNNSDPAAENNEEQVELDLGKFKPEKLKEKDYIAILATSESFKTDYPGYQVEESTFKVTESTPGENWHTTDYECTVVNKDGSLSIFMTGCIEFSFEEKEWELDDVDCYTEKLTVHHGLELSDEELKPILEACLGYAVESVPAYTVTTNDLSEQSDRHYVYETVYTFQLFSEQYTYGGIEQTLTLTFEAREGWGPGNDTFLDGAHSNWSLYDYGVDLSDMEMHMDFDWVTCQLNSREIIQMYFEDRGSYYEQSILDGIYYRGNLSFPEEFCYLNSDFDPVFNIDRSCDLDYARENVKFFLEGVMTVDFEDYSDEKTDAYAALMAGQPYEVILTDPESGKNIPHEAVVFGCYDKVEKTYGPRDTSSIGVLLVTLEGIYYIEPIDNITYDDDAETANFNLTKLEIVDSGKIE